MLADQNFVKKLASCEIMGGANNICSDKTGTLTKNQMTWTNLWAGGTESKFSRPDSKMDMKEYVQSEKIMKMIIETVSCNTEGNAKEAGATELAMLRFLDFCGVDFEKVRKNHFLEPMFRFPFDSARKRMSTVIQVADDERTEHGYNKRIHVKGASEIILTVCTHYLNEAGEKKPMDEDKKREIIDVISKFAKSALRTIAFAYKDLK